MISSLLKSWTEFPVTSLLALVFGSATLLFLSANVSPTSDQVSPAIASSIDDSRIRSMDPEQLSELRRKKKQFDNLTDSEREELREFHAALQQHPERASLTSVMRSYYEWYKLLDSNDQTKVSSKVDLAERVILIHEMRKKQAEQSSPFPDKDLQAFSKWLEEIASNKTEEIRAEFARFMKDRQRRPNEFSRPPNGTENPESVEPRVMLRRLLVNELMRGGRGNSGRGRPEGYLKSIITDSDYDDLISRLTTENQKRFQDSPENPGRSMRALQMLVLRPYATEVELQQFYFKELTAKQRDELDKMSPEFVSGQLRFLFGVKLMGGDVKEIQLPVPQRPRN